MKSQRRFAPTGGEFTPESVARFIGICTCFRLVCLGCGNLLSSKALEAKRVPRARLEPVRWITNE